MKPKSIKLIFYLLGLILILGETTNVFSQSIRKAKIGSKISIKQKTDARRKEVELLMLKGEYQHDGSGELMYIGTIESVPALLKVLETYPAHIYLPCKYDLVIPPSPPPLMIDGVVIVAAPQRKLPEKDCSPKKSYICTYAHAAMALRKITGQNFFDYEDWKNWWSVHPKNKEVSN